MATYWDHYVVPRQTARVPVQRAESEEVPPAGTDVDMLVGVVTYRIILTRRTSHPAFPAARRDRSPGMFTTLWTVLCRRRTHWRSFRKIPGIRRFAQRAPLVEGTTPANRSSGSTAARNARAIALYWASAMWCGSRP